MKLKSSKKADPVEAPKSNKDIVKEKYPKAECIKLKHGYFHICSKARTGGKMLPIHSGVSKNESDAWKRAAHEVL